ncbi:hypothetical protein V6615_11870 [Oscillospiraceae bacterium PP1C4]
MIKITTWDDVQSFQNHGCADLCSLVTDRFKRLHQIYCSNGFVPLEQFSLQNYGEIFIIEHSSEIDGKLFEEVTKHKVNHSTIYVAAFLSNNEICSDFFIPAEILNDDQIQQLEQEL